MSLIIRLIKENDYNSRQTISSINLSLNEAGLPNYHLVSNSLPNDIPLPWIRWSWSDFNNLRYFAVKLRENLTLTPDDILDDPEIKSELLKEHIAKHNSHLICHSLYDGYYVPLDFQDVTLPNNFLNNIGSSINLCNELKKIAEKLEFNLGIYTPDFELLYEQRVVELNNELLGYEKFLILYLYNMAIASIKYNLIIEFG